jgi:hypothetical protein
MDFDKKYLGNLKNFGSNTVGTSLERRPCHRQGLARNLAVAFAFGSVVFQRR